MNSVQIYGALVAALFAGLGVSESTVTTHSARLFDKLGARRRSQAVQLGKNAGLIP
jgi:DNA-binding CsgD family transcriptional regulator